MENQYKNTDIEEPLLENRENFLSLDDLAEEEFPCSQEDNCSEMDRETSYRILNRYFETVYGPGRSLNIAKKFYGIGQESKSLADLADEFSVSPEWIRKVVSRPSQPKWKQLTLKVLNSIKTED